jgi:hypothetical protein
MMVIPTTSVPAQSFNVALNGQACTIRITQKTTGLFLDVLVNNALIVGGVLCLDRTRIVRDAYLGFIGDLFFVDTQGTSDPYYSDLGSQYLLLYAAPGEL